MSNRIICDLTHPKIVSPNSATPMKFSLSELAGSLGDFGTIIPLIIAVGLVSDVNARYVLLFFGIWFILTGLYYRLPIPLEPMKAIAVIVIAGGISSGEIAAAGLILGVIFLVLGYGRFFAVIDRWVPESVVRGIQLGLALLLFKASADFVIKDPFFFIVGIAIVIAFLVLFRYRRIPDLSSLCVIGVGLLGGLYPVWHTPREFYPCTPAGNPPSLGFFICPFNARSAPGCPHDSKRNSRDIAPDKRSLLSGYPSKEILHHLSG